MRQLDATYFDTADHALRRAGFGLRVRDGEGGRKQTLKSASAGGTLRARRMGEPRLSVPVPDGATLAGDAGGGDRQRRRPCTRCFTTKRRAHRCAWSAVTTTVIEVVVDRGET